MMHVIGEEVRTDVRPTRAAIFVYEFPRPWWAFWRAPRVYPVFPSPIHPDWKQLKVTGYDRAHVSEAWFNLVLMAHVCQNAHTGEWACSLDLGTPFPMRFPTRDIAIQAAQQERATRG